MSGKIFRWTAKLLLVSASTFTICHSISKVNSAFFKGPSRKVCLIKFSSSLHYLPKFANVLADRLAHFFVAYWAWLEINVFTKIHTGIKEDASNYKMTVLGLIIVHSFPYIPAYGRKNKITNNDEDSWSETFTIYNIVNRLENNIDLTFNLTN